MSGLVAPCLFAGDLGLTDISTEAGCRMVSYGLRRGERECRVMSVVTYSIPGDTKTVEGGPPARGEGDGEYDRQAGRCAERTETK